MQVEQFVIFWSYNFPMSISLLFIPAVISFFTSRLFRGKENLLRFSVHLIIINIIIAYFTFLGVEDSGETKTTWALRSGVSVVLTVFFYAAVISDRAKHALFAMGIFCIILAVAPTFFS